MYMYKMIWKRQTKNERKIKNQDWKTEFFFFFFNKGFYSLKLQNIQMHGELK